LQVRQLADGDHAPGCDLDDLVLDFGLSEPVENLADHRRPARSVSPGD
jgi:hypothetical protein